MTLKSKTTDWFPGRTKPVREGVYQRYHPTSDSNLFAYWDGKYWGKLSASPASAVDNKYRISLFQAGLNWRGLVEEVKK